MTNLAFRAALEQMEAWLGDPDWVPDPDALASWNASFQEALAAVEKDAGWETLRARAHAAGRELEHRVEQMTTDQKVRRTGLLALERGGRALRGYGSTMR